MQRRPTLHRLLALLGTTAMQNGPLMPLVGYALGCYAIAGVSGVVWGFVVSTIAVNHAAFCINSLAHMWGPRRYATADTSGNNALLAVLTLGEGWHNNHHFYMSSVRQGFFWWELDVTYYVLDLLAWLGIVHDLHDPPTWAIAGHSRASHSGETSRPPPSKSRPSPRSRP